MKVGVDGVLLGAWADVENDSSILDIGTGSGLIALMMAQKSNAEITAIDIDPDAVLQAKENISNSRWSNRIQVQEVSLQDFSAINHGKFDTIISNPPYFNNSLKAPENSRNTARHTDTLSHNELLAHSIKLLASDGKICLILPLSEGLKCIDLASENGLYCTKMVTVYPKSGATPKRILLEFSFKQNPLLKKDIYIETSERHQYTTEYKELVKEFYLK